MVCLGGLHGFSEYWLAIEVAIICFSANVCVATGEVVDPSCSHNRFDLDLFRYWLMCIRSERLLVGSYVEIYLSWGAVVKALMPPSVVVEPEVFSQPYSRLLQVLVRLQEYVLVLHCTPQPFSEYVVHASTSSIHADVNPSLF